jgi:hypothetical protein
VSKSIMYRGTRITITRGDPVTTEQIDEWKVTGAYDELFVSGSCEKCVVPRCTLGAESLPAAVGAWRDTILKESVGANGESLRVGGKILIADAATRVPTIAENALKRMLHCVTPQGLSPFRFTGEKDHNGGRVVKPNFHTAYNENANGALLNFVTGDNVEPGVATGLYLEGTVAKNSVGRRRAGNEEDLGHFKQWKARAANRWAGHGESPSFHRLVEIAPHALAQPEEPDDSDVFVQNVDFAQRVNQRRLLVGGTSEPRLVKEGADQLRPRMPPRQRAGGGLFIANDATTTPPRPSRPRDSPHFAANSGALLSPEVSPEVLLLSPGSFVATAASTITSAVLFSASAFGSAVNAARELSPFRRGHQSETADGPASSLQKLGNPCPTLSQVIDFTGADQSPPPPTVARVATVTAVLREPPASSKSGKIVNREKEQNNKWLCVCDPQAGNRGRGRPPPHKQGCNHGSWSRDIRVSEKPPEGCIVQYLPSASPRTGFCIFKKSKWWPCLQTGELLDTASFNNHTKRKRKSSTEPTRNCLCIGDIPAKKRKISNHGANHGRFFWGCSKWSHDGTNHCGFFLLED